MVLAFTNQWRKSLSTCVKTKATEKYFYVVVYISCVRSFYFDKSLTVNIKMKDDETLFPVALFTFAK